ncbi:hypothetical protein [Kordia sp.]|uniref:hypothetical protein n=1 Tax=Kordia sp. TaxID=1965332 RepID=UPI003B594149
MLKSITKLGRELSKNEQKFIIGGVPHCYLAYNHCDKTYPDNFAKFDDCMQDNLCGS